MKETFGRQGQKHKKIIVEHTSANPNGPLHVGRARNPILGDTIARILRFGGFDVTTQYYVDDMGKQVAILYWGSQHLRSDVKHKKADHKYVDYYQKAISKMEKDRHIKDEIEKIVQRAEKGDKKILDEIKSTYEKVLEGMTESLKRINIHIDEFVEESRFVLDGSTDLVVQMLKNFSQTGIEKGALYLDLERFGIHGRNNKFFITRKDGTSLYATRDIAYHLWKCKQADILINILGEDHKLESEFVKIILKLLNRSTPEVIFYSFVSLPEGKMSTRKGRVVYLDDLIDEAVIRAKKEISKRRESNILATNIEYIAQSIATAAIRYNIIKVKAEKPIVFKWEEALNFDGQSAPFIQYAHARCCSILKKVQTPNTLPSNIHYEHEAEINLIKMLTLFPENIMESIQHRNPSIIAEYAFALASCFNIFYRDCRVLDSEHEIERLQLVIATRQVLHNSLNLLGINALEEM
jgi:arginyl-tRNA synthetase